MPPAPPIAPAAPPPAVPGIPNPGAPRPGPPAPVTPTGVPLAAAPNVNPQPANPVQGVTQPQGFDTQGALAKIAQYYQIPGQTAAITGQQKANAFNAQTQFENAQNMRQLQAQRLQDQTDQSKYKVFNTKDGVQVVGPQGQQVSIGQYVAMTGANPADALKSSTNPKDQQFVQDYTNFETFLNAAMNRGKSAEDAQVYSTYVKANPSLATLNPQQATQMFLSQYGDYYGLGQTGQTPSANQYTPVYSPSIENYIGEKQALVQAGYIQPPIAPTATTAYTASQGTNSQNPLGSLTGQ